MKNVLWDATICLSCKNLHCYLLLTAQVPISLILVTLMMVEICSSETSVLIRATRRHIPEGGILHCHSRGLLKYYIALTGWTL
jgi:hypothetical protein